MGIMSAVGHQEIAMHRAHCALFVALAVIACSGCASEEAPTRATAVPGLSTLSRPALTTPSALPSASPSPSPVSSVPAAAAADTYTVQSGDNLSSIAARFYNDASEWRPIFEANRDRLDGPESLRTGMVLRIPPRPTATTVQSTPQR